LEDKMGRACSACGEIKMHTKFWFVNMNKRDNSEVIGTYERMDVKEIRLDGVDWSYLAQDRDRCQVLLKTLKNVRIL
jgi:hypothetical protein